MLKTNLYAFCYNMAVPFELNIQLSASNGIMGIYSFCNEPFWYLFSNLKWEIILFVIKIDF